MPRVPTVSQTFLVRDARVFVGERLSVATDVYVHDGLIERLGRRLTPPPGVTIVDGAGRTLLPGLIDAHAHSWGDARTLSAMLFSGSASQRMPALVSFQATPEWSEVRLPLAAFGGADLSQLRGLAFTAGLPAGPFTFAIDDVRIE